MALLPRGRGTIAKAHYRAADSKRDQFRRNLEKSGVLDMLTQVLVALHEEPEKPISALDFLKHHLGVTAPETPEIEALRLEVAEVKEKCEAVLEENKKLKAKLSQYEPAPEEERSECTVAELCQETQPSGAATEVSRTQPPAGGGGRHGRVSAELRDFTARDGDLVSSAAKNKRTA